MLLETTTRQICSWWRKEEGHSNYDLFNKLRIEDDSVGNYVALECDGGGRDHHSQKVALCFILTVTLLSMLCFEVGTNISPTRILSKSGILSPPGRQNEAAKHEK